MALSEIEFVSRYSGIYEHSAWVAEAAAPIAMSASDVDIVAQVMADCVDNASSELRLALIRAHPDLAGKAQIAGELTEDSTSEQAGAGLDRCSPEEYERFQSLNLDYHTKFGFPFVLAVRDRSRADILATFETRLNNDHDTEFETALAEVHKIARLRLEAMGTD